MKFPPAKFCWLFIGLLLLSTGNAFAQKKSSNKGNTEQRLIFQINGCLGNEDPYCYMHLFPDMDTLSKLVMKAADSSSKDFMEMAALQQQPERMLSADSVFKARLKQSFDNLIAQGKQQGMHWSSLVPVRYELVRAFETRDAVYEKLAPIRFTGYIFVMDAATRKTYGFTVSEMLQLNNEWYGGYLGEIYEAQTRDEYEDMRLAARREKKEPAKDTVASPAPEEDDDDRAAHLQKMIAERKFYTGMFDNEIPVQLYVRSLKGACKEGICSWEAIYKFGDQDDYILLTVSKTAEGKWTFTEDPPTGSMELTLKNGKYTGTWTATDNQTGYEVKLSETPASSKKIERLEEAFLDLRSGKSK